MSDTSLTPKLPNLDEFREVEQFKLKQKKALIDDTGQLNYQALKLITQSL